MSALKVSAVPAKKDRGDSPAFDPQQQFRALHPLITHPNRQASFRCPLRCEKRHREDDQSILRGRGSRGEWEVGGRGQEEATSPFGVQCAPPELFLRVNDTPGHFVVEREGGWRGGARSGVAGREGCW